MKRIKVKIVGQHSSLGRGVGFYHQFLVEALAKNDSVELVDNNPDIVHFTFFDLFIRSLSINKTVPFVVTVHDLTPLVLPELYPQGIKGRVNLYLQKRAVSRASAIITDSESSRRDITRFLNYPIKQIQQISLACDPIYKQKSSPSQLKSIKQKYSLPDKFILYIGGVNPNKNIPTLVKLCIKLNFDLVIVGSEFTKTPPKNNSLKGLLGLQNHNPELNDYYRVLNLSQANKNIHLLGFVPSSDYLHILHLAHFYCQPSFYEGFGLPLLEAMTAKCMAVSSNSGSLPEVYDQSTINFDPKSELEMSKALTRAFNLNENQKSDIVRRNYEKSLHYSWSNTSRQTAELYHKVINNKNN